MKQLPSIEVTLITAILCAGLVQNAMAASTMVTHAVSTKHPLTSQELTSVQELWTFEEILGAQKLTSKTNQVDDKGIIQTWDETNGNKLSHTDAEGRTTKYTYNATNQRDSMTEAFGTPEARTTSYEYVNANIDLVTKTTSPSIYADNFKDLINTYDANQNIIAVAINGFDALGVEVSRVTTFDHDQYGKVTSINGPLTDVDDLGPLIYVDDITILEYYDCNIGAECGQLKKVTNAVGHVSTYDQYDAASRLTQSTDSNGIVTTYSYHPRGWLLTMTQTPAVGAARITSYDYDNVGQLKKVTLADGSEQNYEYDAAHDLRAVFDNLNNRVEYTYDPKGNRTHTLIKDPSGTLVRSTITTYNHRNFIQSINNAGSLTQLINDAVGNLSAQTDPNDNPDTSNTFDALDRLSNTVDALTNNSTYAYDVADRLSQVTSPNGSVTQYEYDDLGNQTKEISNDRGTLVYTHD
ncbi:MAG: RHS repeat protein, partial [Arenicella sp.]|nr:RHS repeat protein [Arenicella sp.]